MTEETKWEDRRVMTKLATDVSSGEVTENVCPYNYEVLVNRHPFLGAQAAVQGRWTLGPAFLVTILEAKRPEGLILRAGVSCQGTRGLGPPVGRARKKSPARCRDVSLEASEPKPPATSESV